MMKYEHFITKFFVRSNKKRFTKISRQNFKRISFTRLSVRANAIFEKLHQFHSFIF